LEDGVRELARLEKLSAGRDHLDAAERSWDSIRATFREDVTGDAP
jgi:hypothetical protein